MLIIRLVALNYPWTCLYNLNIYNGTNDDTQSIKEFVSIDWNAFIFFIYYLRLKLHFDSTKLNLWKGEADQANAFMWIVAIHSTVNYIQTIPPVCAVHAECGIITSYNSIVYI